MKNKKLLIILSILVSILALGAIAALTGNILADETYTVRIDYVIDGEDKPFETTTVKFAAGSTANILAPVKDGYHPRQASFVAIVNSDYTVRVVYDCLHTKGFDEFLRFDTAGDVIYCYCHNCGDQIDVTSDLRLQLTFDNNITSELTAWNSANGYDFSLRQYDQSGVLLNSNFEANNEALTLKTNGIYLMKFDSSVLNDSDFSVISFDWKATSFSGTTSKQGLFGLLTNDAGTVFIAGLDRCDGTLYLGGTARELNFDQMEMVYNVSGLHLKVGKWYSFTIVVNNKTGVATVSITTDSGEAFIEPYTISNFTIPDTGEIAFRFGQLYNIYHVPCFDNFKVYAIN